MRTSLNITHIPLLPSLPKSNSAFTGKYKINACCLMCVMSAGHLEDTDRREQCNDDVTSRALSAPLHKQAEDNVVIRHTTPELKSNQKSHGRKEGKQ